MKNTFLIILSVIFITICLIAGTILNIRAEKKAVMQENKQYQNYLDKEILGADVATLISKVINHNEKNDVQKDEKGYYVENNQNSIKIDLKMITIDRTYPMEEIYNKEVARFVQNFNFIKFKCINIEYHEKTGKVSKLTFEELE